MLSRITHQALLSTAAACLVLADRESPGGKVWLLIDIAGGRTADSTIAPHVIRHP